MTKHEIDRLRKKRNDELLDLVQMGYTGNFVSPEMTHFPRRPQIKKNENDIKRLYGEKARPITEPKFHCIEQNFIPKIISSN